MAGSFSREVGAPLEVFSTEEGYSQVWSEAVVKALLPAEDKLHVPKLEVQYVDFLDESGQPLCETFSVRDPRLRPAPAGRGQPFASYKVGVSVEVKEDEVWCEGVLESVGTAEEGSGATVRLLYHRDKSLRTVSDPNSMRPSLEWRHGRWHIRLPPASPSKPPMVEAAVPSPSPAPPSAAPSSEAEAAPELVKAPASPKRSPSPDYRPEDSDDSAEKGSRRGGRHPKPFNPAYANHPAQGAFFTGQTNNPQRPGSAQSTGSVGSYQQPRPFAPPQGSMQAPANGGMPLGMGVGSGLGMQQSGATQQLLAAFMGTGMPQLGQLQQQLPALQQAAPSMSFYGSTSAAPQATENGASAQAAGGGEGAPEGLSETPQGVEGRQGPPQAAPPAYLNPSVAQQVRQSQMLGGLNNPMQPSMRPLLPGQPGLAHTGLLQGQTFRPMGNGLQAVANTIAAANGYMGAPSPFLFPQMGNPLLAAMLAGFPRPQGMPMLNGHPYMQRAPAPRAASPEAKVRRSSRTSKKRIMMVEGEPVLKANNYTLNEGEPSVYEQELLHAYMREDQEEDKKVDRGSRWIAAPPPVQPQEPKGPASAELTAQQRQEQRRQAQSESARQQHNNAIKRYGQQQEGKRASFFAHHIEALTPFVPAHTLANIKFKASAWEQSSVAINTPPPPPVDGQPSCVTGTMREYQLEGLRWMVSRLGDAGVNCILADEMGLGKTLQSISFIAYMQAERGIGGPSLVVVPLSVLPSWMSEFKKWAPHLRVVRFHCNDVEERMRLRREVLADPSCFDVAVTTYEMMQSQALGNALCSTITWRWMVLDEGHKIKNELTSTAQTMRHVARQNTLLLTGTPLQNNLHELWALLNFLHPDVFPDSTPFDTAFDLARHRVDAEVLEAAHRLLEPLCLRRLKEDVEKTLPPRVETRINCPLSAMQTFWYRRLLLKDSKLLSSVENEFSGLQESKGGEKENDSWRKLQHLVMQLRKCCNHPYLFPGAEPDFDGVTTGEDLVGASGKMVVLDKMLAKLQAKGHRVTLFSQYNRMLDVIEDFLIMRGYKYVRLDGSTNRVQRMIDINRFNREGSSLFIYILNTRAGGLGVNLQSADTCILYDSDWNPQWDLQAMARVHRIGQKRVCHVYRFCTAGTVEERVQMRAEKKLYLDQMVNRGAVSGGDGEDLEGLNKGELLSMLRFGADRIFRNEAGEAPTDSDLDAIIDRSAKLGKEVDAVGAGAVVKAEGGAAPVSLVTQAAPTAEGSAQAYAASQGALQAASDAAQAASSSSRLTSEKQSAATFEAREVPLSTFMLQGTDYSAARSVKDIASEFWGRAERQRKSRLINVDGYDVLRENNYALNEGEPSVYGRETAALAPLKRKRGRQVAGTDYAHSDVCQVCWDGGSLVCCDECPASYHATCLGFSEEDLKTTSRWTCPHHRCSECNRGTAAAGGLLFRCQACSAAFCEDHLPVDADVLQHCPRFQALGQIHPRQACFIHCSADCRAFTETMPAVFDESVLVEKRAKAAEEEKERKAALAVAAAAEAKAAEERERAERAEKAAERAAMPVGRLPKMVFKMHGKKVAAAATGAAEGAAEEDLGRQARAADPFQGEPQGVDPSDPPYSDGEEGPGAETEDEDEAAGRRVKRKTGRGDRGDADFKPPRSAKGGPKQPKWVSQFVHSDSD